MADTARAQGGKTRQCMEVGLVVALLGGLAIVAIVAVWPGRLDQQAFRLAERAWPHHAGAALIMVLLLLGLAALTAYLLRGWQRAAAARRLMDQALAALAHEIGMTLPVSANGPGAPAPHRPPLMLVESAARQLGQRQRQLTQALQALPAAMLVVDAQGAILQSNRAAAILADGLDQDLPGSNVEQAMQSWVPADGARWPLLLAQAASLGEVTAQASHADGRAVRIHMARLNAQEAAAGEAAQFVVCLSDVSLQRQAERQRDDLLGFIAHDLRSPQASLISLVQLQRICSPRLPEDEVLQHVDSLARNTLALCDELVQVLRAEHHPVQRSLMDLVLTFETALREVQTQAAARPLQIARQWPAELRAFALIDESAVRRALVKLLSNAIKFSPPSSKVTLQVERQGPWWVLSVQDQGPGIAAAELSSLFRRPSQLAARKPGLAPGAGLGLVFVDTVACRHGGHVRAHSTPGAGARFELSLPVDEAP